MIARFCPQCGSEVSGDYSFCPRCGTRLPVIDDKPSDINEQLTAIICPTCGFQNVVGSRSCESCGASLKGIEKKQIEQREPGSSGSLPEEKAASPPGGTAISEDRPIPGKQSEERQARFRKQGRGKTRGDRPEAAQKTSAGKKFHLESFQITAIAAAMLLGAILVYGLMSSRPSATQQDDSSSGAQQAASGQAAAGQPSADVLHEIDHLRQVVDKNPSDLESTLKLSNMLQDNGFYDQAVIYYKRYLDKNPNNVDARVDYGVTLFEGGHTQDAITQLDEAVKMNPKHQVGYFNLGIVYLNAGDFDKANAAFKKCVEIDPNSDIGKRAAQTLQQHANIKN